MAAGRSDALSLYDVAPLALALLGQPIPDGLDGAVPTHALDPGFVARAPIRSGGSVADRSAGGAFSEDEAAAVAAHLKDLGYIE